MHVVINKDGKPTCYHCGREFDVHPSEKTRAERYAKLCAVKDDDLAARAFYHHKQGELLGKNMNEVWCERFGFHMFEKGSITVDGIKICSEPGVDMEQMMLEFDKHVIPGIRQQMLEALDGTQKRKQEEFVQKIKDGLITVHDSSVVWAPETPSAQEIYPNGYRREQDGSVVAL